MLEEPLLHLLFGQSGSESISPVQVTVIIGGFDFAPGGFMPVGGVPGHKTIAGVSSNGDGS